MNKIKQRRKALNLSQQQLAAEAEIERSRMCRIENGQNDIRRDEASRLARILKCRPEDLDLRYEDETPYPQEGRDLVKLYRKRLDYRHAHERPVESRLPVLRDKYGVDVNKLLADPPLNRFVHEGYFQSALELYYWSERPRLEGALPTEAAPLYAGFDRHPVVCPETRRVIGHIPVPAMVTKRWLAIPQVAVTTPRYYRMDAIVITLEGGRRRIFALELDGPGKPPPDPKRERDLGLRIIRFSLEEIKRGVTINEKLDQLGF